jgi:chemosensory pili system protein ChpA (sensor histidine kinase/response regulator)
MQIKLFIPIHHALLHVILIRVGKAVYAVPAGSLARVYTATADQFQREGDNLNLHIGDERYPVTSFARLLGRATTFDQRPRNAQPMLLAHAGTGISALAVDEIIDDRESVIKSFGGFLKDIPNIIGGLSLANGDVVPVLDHARLLRETTLQLPEQEITEQEDELQLKDILVVEDSLSARKSLKLLLEDAGYQVRTAVDGLQAINAIKDYAPHVVLTDLEMPNMNGLDLCAHIRADRHTHQLPIIMITSRANIKHRELAEKAGVNAYLTKPYMDEEVLNQVRAVMDLATVTQP